MYCIKIMQHYMLYNILYNIIHYFYFLLSYYLVCLFVVALILNAWNKCYYIKLYYNTINCLIFIYTIFHALLLLNSIFIYSCCCHINIYNEWKLLLYKMIQHYILYNNLCNVFYCCFCCYSLDYNSCMHIY